MLSNRFLTIYVEEENMKTNVLNNEVSGQNRETITTNVKIAN
jgi:hypothetical protein